jgi:hypothetical protein
LYKLKILTNLKLLIVRLEYGNLLDEIYCLLEKPEVISKIEEEKNKIKIPIKHENLDNCVLITQLETKSREIRGDQDHQTKTFRKNWYSS